MTGKTLADLDPPARIEEIKMAQMIRAQGRVEGFALIAPASIADIIQAQREVLAKLGLTRKAN